MAIRNGFKELLGRMSSQVATDVIDGGGDSTGLPGGGSFEMISISELNIDPAYQRNAVEDEIKTISRNWNQRAVGCIVVARRPDGSLWIIDGQQRTLAAKMRGFINEMPCVVYDVADSREEAGLFRLINAGRRQILPYVQFKSDVHSGDPAACELKRMCDHFGLEVANTSKAGTVRCISALRDCFRLFPNDLRRVFPLVAKVSEDDIIRDRVLRPLVDLERRLSKEGQSLTRSPYRERVLRYTSAQIEKATYRLIDTYPKGNTRSWSMGVASLLDAGARKPNKLSRFFVIED